MGKQVSGLYSENSKGHGVVIDGRALREIDHDIKDITSKNSAGDGITIGVPRDLTPEPLPKSRLMKFLNFIEKRIVAICGIGSFVIAALVYFGYYYK
ncbi:TPA: hypothetical protein HLU11_13270 [Escherichia coli]|nr:hypothetical protein [Escherichia coli]HCJ8722726.1 hypothetical protein [Escherichia coli]